MNMNISSGKTKKYTKEDKTMIIMDLKINNFFAFKNFHMNMSYPKKIVNSYIEDEFLTGRSNFRYKKVNILMGANATGKTTIGKMLMKIFNFIKDQQHSYLINVICDNTRKASFSMDFVVESYRLYRLDVEIERTREDEDLQIISACTRYVDILEKDSYESCVKRIEKIPLELKSNYAEELKKLEKMGWLFSYPEDISTGIVNCSKNNKYPMILDHTLRALDPSVQAVEKIDMVENSYVIRMENQDLVIQDGEVIKNNILSSGTKSGIDIAKMLAAIMNGDNGFYYCDEKFSYVHSDVEKAFLSVMIGGLRENDQLFFTTHNTDILDLPLPKHAFVFLKKDIYDEDTPIKCVSASDYLKRNTDSLRNAVENDLFSVSPNLDLIYEIEDI